MNVCFSECVQMSVYVLMCTGVYLCGHVVMVNSICQLDWATNVLRCLVKCDSGCVCEHVPGGN